MAKVNYIRAAATVNPFASFKKAHGPLTPYEEIEWSDKTTPIPKATLEATYLDIKKQEKVQQLLQSMESMVSRGFLSDALVPGNLRLYDSAIQGQIAVVGAYVYVKHANETADATFKLISMNPNTGIRSFDDYNLDQLRKLFEDLANFSSEIMLSGETKINEVMAISTGNVEADLDAVAAVSM